MGGTWVEHFQLSRFRRTEVGIKSIISILQLCNGLKAI